MRRVIALLLACASAAGQDQSAYERLDLRVIESRARSVFIDRGASEGVTIGDVVVLYPVGGAVLQGSVTHVEERRSEVELADPRAQVAVGTRGEIRVLRERAAGEPERELPEHPPWENPDEEWTPGMPLLDDIGAVRPADRARVVTGRMYLIADTTVTDDGDRSDSFFRAGTDLAYENPFGRGGGLHVDSELNLRDVNVPDEDDDDASRLRVDRFSYYEGGTRFDTDRWEAGRFLQHGMPEFGVVDGAEFTRRLGKGHRIGGSVGFMPEPDRDMETGADFQVAAYYEWIADDSERLVATGGFQKTLHDGDADRDLFIGKVRYLPITGWNFHGTAWVDYYTAGDGDKSPGVELTQGYFTTGRRFENGDGVNVTYTHMMFPEIERNEFLTPGENAVGDNRNDRLAASGWTALAPDLRLTGRAGLWDDEDDHGADAEVGLDFDDLAVRRSRTSVALFDTRGQFSNVTGTRLSFTRYIDDGHWDVSYELAVHDQNGFSDGSDDVLQHRARGTRAVYTASDWNLSFYVEALFGNDADSASAGVYLQKSF